MYQHGQSVEQLIEVAIYLYNKAAKQGLTEAHNQLGLIYSNNIYGKKNYDESLIWFKKAANQNYMEAFYHLGYFYSNEFDRPKNVKESIKWYTYAAEKGHWPLQYNLGSIYFYNVGEPDYRKSFKWYMKAAEQGLNLAQYRVGMMYNEGNGVNKNLKEAAKPITLAAVNDHHIAQNQMCVLFP